MDKPRCIPAAGVRIAAACAVSLSVLAAPASAAPAKITSKTVEPAVIPADGSSGAVVTVRTDAPALSVTLDLAAGGAVPFQSIDPQTFSAVLTPAQLLFQYFPDDVNRNF